MATRKFAWLLAAVSILAAPIVAAQEARPYTEGPVTVVSYIKTKPGMFDAYMKWVATQRKALMDGEVKAGIVLGYRVYLAEPRSPQDANVILTVTYKNFAAFDGLADKVDAVGKTIWESRGKANEAEISREAMREVLGSQTIRELVLK
jgi:hypothetical protein